MLLSLLHRLCLLSFGFEQCSSFEPERVPTVAVFLVSRNLSETNEIDIMISLFLIVLEVVLFQACGIFENVFVVFV